jgi:hypothetical protein
MAWLYIDLDKLRTGEVILTDDDGDEIAKVHSAQLDRDLQQIPDFGNPLKPVYMRPGPTRFTLEMWVTDEEGFRAALDKPA